MTVLPLGSGCAPETPAVVCIVRLGIWQRCQPGDNARVHSLAMRLRRELAQIQAEMCREVRWGENRISPETYL